MKKSILLLFLAVVFTFAGQAAYGQCDPNTASPIKCSYYTEGYQDGTSDARANRSNDYRRYRDKYDRQYESYYRDGYEKGYLSVNSQSGRWSYSQRNAYDAGYLIGQDDRRRSGSGRETERNNGGYDQNIGLYFQQGYNDGYNNRPRRYDYPVDGNTNNPTYPGGGSTGTAYWNGRVDDRGNIVIRGNSMYAENVSGNGIQTYNQNMNGYLPRRSTMVMASKSAGRGSVSVIQQPNRSNNFTAIVQVNDSKGGAGDYRIEISWTGPANVEEPYRSGSVYWRGRVDQNVDIIISGSDVQTQDVSNTGLANVNFNMNGYLARRPGTVNIRRKNGRGTVSVIQQPNWENDFTAIIRIFDPKGGADDYEVEIGW